MGTRPVLRILLLVLLLVIGAAGRVTAAEVPVLLADVNRGPTASFGSTLAPVDFFRLGDRLLFSTRSSNSSVDEGILWSTDGTAGGTRAVSSSLCPFPCDGIKPLAVWRGLGILQASSGEIEYNHILRLWRTDGTKAGTFPLTGPLIDDPLFYPLEVVSSPESGFFYMAGCRREPYECLLWRSDGTRAGTSVLQDTRGAKFLDPHSLTFWQGRLYFVAYDGGEEAGLWSTDGTPEGTAFVAAVDEGYEWRSVLQATSSRLFFSSGEGAEDLWVTDGTPEGTRRLADLDPPGCSVQPRSCGSSDLESMFTLEDKVYFITHRKNHGTEIWSSDGTESGTRPLIETGFGLGLPVRFDGRWLLPVSIARGQPATLWSADDGFTRLEPLSGCAGGTCPQELLVFLHRTDSGAWLFAGRDAAHGDEVWITDGTAAGTRLLADICPGPCAGYRGRYPSSVVFGSTGSTGSAAGKTYFAAFSDPRTGTKDELWVTDGTPAGTHRVAEQVSELGFLGDLAVFGTGGYGNPRSTVWSTDGTAAGTRQVTDLRRIAPSSYPDLHPLRNGVVFLANEGDRKALWTSDGRPAGTSRLFEFSPDRTPSPSGEPWIRVRDSLLFPVSARTEGRSRTEIWKTDGTAQGTGRVATLPRGLALSLGLFTSWNGKLLFQTESSLRGCSFWSSDGTAAGTREILPPEPGRRCPTAVLALGSRFVFVAQVRGWDGLVPQIFVSDGTPEGTRQISHIRTYREPFEYDEPVAVDGVAFFRISTVGRDSDGWEVWRTNGTPEGTYQAFRTNGVSLPLNLYGFRGSLYLSGFTQTGVDYFRIPVHGGEPVRLAQTDYFFFDYPPAASFTPLGDRLLFVARDNAHGVELWVTDGTPAGTRVLRDIRPGPMSSGPSDLLQVGDRVFFTAQDGEHGWELWASDGTAQGTRLVWDLNPGGFSSFTDYVLTLTVAGGYLFFSADDGETGVEPWSLLLRSAQ